MITSLVYFGADWCPHCKRMAPVISAASSNINKMGIHVSKVDADESKDIVKEYNVGGLPSVVLMNGTKEVARKSGYLSESQLMDFINANK